VERDNLFSYTLVHALPTASSYHSSRVLCIDQWMRYMYMRAGSEEHVGENGELCFRVSMDRRLGLSVDLLVRDSVRWIVAGHLLDRLR